MAEPLLPLRDECPPNKWRGGALKCSLVGMGLLFGGMGLLFGGMRIVNKVRASGGEGDKSDSGGRLKNFSPPDYVDPPLNQVMSAGTREDSFGNYYLHDVDTVDPYTLPPENTTKLVHQLIEQLDVEDIYFILDQPGSIAEPDMEGRTAQRRLARSLQGGYSGGLPTQMEDILHEQDMSRPIRTEFNTIFEMAKISREVHEATPGKKRDIIHLIKTIELTSAFLRKIKYRQSMKEFYVIGLLILTDLDALADAQTDDFHKTAVERYRRIFGVQSKTLKEEEEEELTVPKALSDLDALEAKLQQLSVQSLELLESLYHPILDISSYIDNYISKGIKDYEEAKGIETSLRLNSTIRVDFKTKVPANPNLHGPKAPMSVSRYFTLRAIITGQYLYETTRMRDSSKREYRIEAIEHKQLINEIFHNNLQSIMEEELKNYRDQPTNAANFKSLYQELINLRCLEFLDNTHRAPVFKKAVEKFIKGDIQAKEVYFHDTLLNGVFMIPLDDGRSGGVMLSVDDNSSYNVDSFFEERVSWDCQKSEDMTADCQQFKEWILSKIPYYESAKYEKDEEAFKFKSYRLWSNIPDLSGGRPVNILTKTPFTFGDSQNRENLANRLFDGLMNRLESDIDTVVFSYPEQITEISLEVTKKILSMLSGLVFTFGPNTLVAMIGKFLLSLALDAFYVGASAIQSHMSDVPDQAEAYRNDAIIAGCLAGVGAISTGVPIVSGSIKKVYSIQNVQLALRTYRQVKNVSRSAISSALKKMNWERLGNQYKVELLVNTAKINDLATLSSADAVKTSIRNNLNLSRLPKTSLDWKDFATEKVNVQKYLDSTLTDLVDANNNMRHLLDTRPLVPRITVPADTWVFGPRSSETMMDALTPYKNKDLLDFEVIKSLNGAMYKQSSTSIRLSDSSFIEPDIASEAFKKALLNIKNAQKMDSSIELADLLYASVMNYRPFGKGDAITARALYTLAWSRKDKTPFMALAQNGKRIFEPLKNRVSIITNQGMSGKGAVALGKKLAYKKSLLSDYSLVEGCDVDLTFPELNNIYLINSRLDIEGYNNAYSVLSTGQKNAIKQWTSVPNVGELPVSVQLNNFLRSDMNIGRMPKKLKETYFGLTTLLAQNPTDFRRTGDFIRIEQYFSAAEIPFISGQIKVGDILDTGRSFTSFSGTTKFAREVILKKTGFTAEAQRTAIVIYKVENGGKGLALSERVAAGGKFFDEQLYRPHSYFKIKKISIATPNEVTSPYRISVVLEESSSTPELAKLWYVENNAIPSSQVIPGTNSQVIPGTSSQVIPGTSSQVIPGANTYISMAKECCTNIENQINIKWSSSLSNEGMLDFIWCPEINLKKLSRPSSGSEYIPDDGGAVVFMHSDGSNLFIQNNEVSPFILSRYITRLDDYYHTSSPLILAACRAGYESETGGSIAQKLANALNRKIISSPGIVRIECNDEKTHILKIYSDQPFLTFTPSNPS
ncbi:hypothetical protein [Yersinia kristensenii]|uniref:hypothetical protein n=1 Tax=Yersinia kristensenii TaxID=28152 RepID=UPI0011C78FED|nr:hypothetical protein [Yersinia kristensenii]